MFSGRKLLSGILAIGLLLLVGCGQTPSKQSEQKPDTGANQTEQKSESNAGSKSPAGAAKTISIKWGTIAAGGAWQVLGNAMLEDIKKANPQITGSTVPSGPSANLMGVHNGEFNIGFSLTDSTAEAWQGEGYFKQSGKMEDLRNIAAFYPQSTQIIVLAKSGINTIADLKGKRISPGPKGTSNDLEFQRLLNLYGMSYKDVNVQFLSFDDAGQQFMDGHLDCLAYTTLVFPFGSVINIASQKEIKFLEIPDDKIAEMAKFQGLIPYSIPPGVYKGFDQPIKGFASRAHLVVRKDMPDDVVYSIVKTIAENHARYGTVVSSMKWVKPEDMAADAGIPLHPGAEKYYREKGWLK